MRLASGQAPVTAAASGHSATAAMRPSRPGGSCVVTVERNCWPSGRVRARVKVVPAPAVVGELPALCAGANGSGDGQLPPAPSSSTVYVAPGLATAPLTGVSVLENEAP